MSNQIIRTSLGVVVAAIALMFAGLANAVIYNSVFDPLSFVGHAQFQFNDACLAADGTHSGTSCSAMLLSATADMTDGTDTGHLDFAPRLPSSAITDIVISGGTLVGVDTSLIGWVFPAPCTGALCGAPWWIQWTSASLPSEIDPVFLFTGTCFRESCTPNETSSAVANHVTFTRVPEPATLFLVVAAMFAAWLSRRRLMRTARRPGA